MYKFTFYCVSNLNIGCICIVEYEYFIVYEYIGTNYLLCQHLVLFEGLLSTIFYSLP